MKTIKKHTDLRKSKHAGDQQNTTRIKNACLVFVALLTFSAAGAQSLDDLAMLGNKQERYDARKKKKGLVLKITQSHWDPLTQSHFRPKGSWTGAHNDGYRFSSEEWERAKCPRNIKRKWKKRAKK